MATDQVPKFIRTEKFLDLLAAHEGKAPSEEPGADVTVSPTATAAVRTQASSSSRSSHDLATSTSPKLPQV